jgi:Mg-chelatase subunit ChlD
LRGHLNVAAASLGTTVVEGEERRAYEAIDGIASPSTGVYRDPGEAITLDLPGDQPIPLTGTLLNPQSRDLLRQLRTFEVSVSLDGESFETILEGELAAARLEQGFVFERPVEARFVRLRFVDDQQPGDQGRSISLGEWKVSSDDLSLIEGADLADVRNGGILVWSDPLVGANTVLAGNDGTSTLDGRDFEEAAFVIGFHHGRAARIDHLEWVDSDRADPDDAFREVRVEASMGGPVGPWTELGSWPIERNVPGTATLQLDEPVWARYLRVSASGHDRERSGIQGPDAIRVIEAPSSDGYRSILAEWGYARSVGPYEWAQGVATPPEPIGDDGSDDVKEGATPLADGDRIRADVLVAEDQDWYRIDVPDGANSITLELGGDVSAVRYRLIDDQDAPVTADIVETADGVRLTAFVDPGSYYLHVEEPKRSVVFSWDTSGSVRPYEPITYAAVSSFARDVDPEREFVQMLAFDDPSPKWLLPYWSGDPTATSRALVEFDRSTADSSNAELAVSTGVAGLSQREGTRALLVITDHESGGYGLTRDLWRSIEEVRPRIFTFEVSTAGSGWTQDRMQAYAAANGGHYAYARNVGDFDAGFRRASCHLRRPKAYTVAVEVAYQEPPGPGTLTVRRGEGAAVPGVEVIFDASGSMGATLPSGESRIDAARGVLRELVGEILPEGAPFALRAFGHITPQSCESRLEVELAPLVRDDALAAIDEIQPKLLSQTPLADALLQVGSDLGDAPPGSAVVVITDGEESCGGDPAAAVDELRAQGIDVQVSIVSLGVEDAATRDAFAALAERAGGSYTPADDLSSLRGAVEAALNPPFEVLDAAGEVIARGRIDGEGIELPMGVYTVRVPGAPPQLIRDVRVPGDGSLSLTLSEP